MGGAAAVAVAGLTVAACGGGSTYHAPASSSSPPTTAPAAPAASASSASSAQPTTSVTIAARSSRLGQIVVDAAGNTLYAFDKDTAGSGSSACYAACAAVWPAATLNGQPSAGPGLTGTLATLTRTDGTKQISLNGHPLYHYAGDGAPGDTNGDGFGGIWHVVHTTGAATTTKPAAAPSMTGGY
jgi:predicted lipoprotein with Yx(FWY)xxD motif